MERIASQKGMGKNGDGGKRGMGNDDGEEGEEATGSRFLRPQPRTSTPPLDMSLEKL